MQPSRLAVVQAAPVFMNAAATVEKAVALIEEAAREGAKLIGFPEVFIPGYPWWIWLGSPAWGTQFISRFAENAIRVDGPELAKIRASAAENNINVLMGYVEVAGATFYMSQALIGDDGRLVYNRRKLKPTHVERAIFGEGDGSDFQVADTPIGRVGSLCCAEHVQPLSKYAMYAMNEQIHIASWPSFTLYKDIAYALTAQANLAASQVYALEGGCYVLHASAVTGQDIFEMLGDTEERQMLLNSSGAKPGGGCSMIFGPDGRPLAEHLPEDQEGIIYADTDPAYLAIAKAVFDPAGHYARADATRLIVNRARREPLTFADALTPATATEIEAQEP